MIRLSELRRWRAPRRWSFIPDGDKIIGVDEGAPLATEPADARVDPEARTDAAPEHLLGHQSIIGLTSSRGSRSRNARSEGEIAQRREGPMRVTIRKID